jgi:hypothetical protein
MPQLFAFPGAQTAQASGSWSPAGCRNLAWPGFLPSCVYQVQVWQCEPRPHRSRRALKSRQRLTAPKIDCRFFGQPNLLVSTGKPRTFGLGASMSWLPKARTSTSIRWPARDSNSPRAHRRPHKCSAGIRSSRIAFSSPRFFLFAFTCRAQRVTNSDSSASAAASMTPASLPSVAGTISSFSQKVGLFRSQALAG